MIRIMTVRPTSITIFMYYVFCNGYNVFIYSFVYLLFGKLWFYRGGSVRFLFIFILDNFFSNIMFLISRGNFT